MIDFAEPEGCVFYESWCTSLEKGAINRAINSIEDDTGVYIEIGCFEGRSTVFTANLINPKTLIAIDPWVPVDHAPYEVEQYKARDIEAIFRNNINVGTAGNVDIKKMKWETYFEKNKPKISYLYLDGPHDEANVRQSLEVIVPLVVKGGVLIGDDYDDHGVKTAVDSFFGKEMTHPTSHRTFYWRND